MSYTYDIRPSPMNRGGGWNLHLFENGEAAGLVDFPADVDEETQLDAKRAAFLRAEAEAKLWMKGRKVYSKRRHKLVVHPALAVFAGLVILIAIYNVWEFGF